MLLWSSPSFLYLSSSLKLLHCCFCLMKRLIEFKTMNKKRCICREPSLLLFSLPWLSLSACTCTLTAVLSSHLLFFNGPSCGRVSSLSSFCFYKIIGSRALRLRAGAVDLKHRWFALFIIVRRTGEGSEGRKGANWVWLVNVKEYECQRQTKTTWTWCTNANMYNYSSLNHVCDRSGCSLEPCVVTCTYIFPLHLM